MHKSKSSVGLQRLEIDARSVTAQIVVDNNGFAALQQPLGCVRSNKTRSACNKPLQDFEAIRNIVNSGIDAVHLGPCQQCRKAPDARIVHVALTAEERSPDGARR